MTKAVPWQVLAHLKNTKGLFKNGERPFAKEPVRSGDQIKLRLTEEAGSEGIVPVCLPFSVVYEDEDLLVIDKPAGLPVHRLLTIMKIRWRMESCGDVNRRVNPFLSAVQSSGCGNDWAFNCCQKYVQRRGSLQCHEGKKD